MLIVGGGIPPSPPRIFNGGGDAHRVKRDAHPSLPYEHPSPPYVPVTPYEQLKFPRVINPDSPLNDSRQLDWPQVPWTALLLTSPTWRTRTRISATRCKIRRLLQLAQSLLCLIARSVKLHKERKKTLTNS